MPAPSFQENRRTESQCAQTYSSCAAPNFIQTRDDIQPVVKKGCLNYQKNSEYGWQPPDFDCAFYGIRFYPVFQCFHNFELIIASVINTHRFWGLFQETRPFMIIVHICQSKNPAVFAGFYIAFILLFIEQEPVGNVAFGNSSKDLLFSQCCEQTISVKFMEVLNLVYLHVDCAFLSIGVYNHSGTIAII